MKRISTRKFFCAAWLVLGSLQLFVGGATGCQSAAATTGANPELLSSNDDNTAAQAGESSDRGVALPNDRPVRISRSFLQDRIKGELRVAKASWDSALDWNEKPTTLPAPQGQVIADFRDFEGCADFQRVDGLKLCFNVMPDVSSVGVNQKEMQLKGLQQLLQSECNGDVSDVKYVSADRQASGNDLESSYTIRFSAQCAGSPIDLEVRLTRL